MSMKKRLISIILVFGMISIIAPWSTIFSKASFSGSLQFDSDGKFTVMQIADTQDNQNPYGRVIAAITNAISRFNPDLVVFSGDNVIETISTTSNFHTAIDKVLAPLIATNTKFAVTFGNHDDEGVGAPSKTDQYNYFKSVGGSLFVDHDISYLDGVGSGVIPIYPNGQTSGTPAYQVYLMDSGSDPSSGSYDCCYTSQVDYYIQRSQTYPTVPSLWFQHVIVPDIYSEGMTTANTGGGVSFTGSGSPFSDNTWYINPSRINWARCSSTSLADVYNEAPACADLSLYQSAAHRSSSAYGSKTLYEAWDTYGNLKGAYFGHDHLNEFTCTTDDGIDLGYGECTNLYKTLGVYAYNDNNPGVSVYQLSTDGSYTNQYAAESDLSIPVVDPTAPAGSIKVTVKTKNSGFLTAYGTDSDVYLDIFYTDGTSWNGYIADPNDSNDFEQGDDNTCVFTDVPIKPVSYINLRDTYSDTDDWTISNSYVYFNVNGTYTQVGSYTSEHKFNSISSVTYSPNPTTWFTANNHNLTFNANSGTGGTVEAIVYGATIPANKIPAVTKTGYTLSSWSPAVPSTGPSTDTTYYAQWGANTYTIGYDGNSNTGGSTASSIHTYDTAKVLTTNGYTKTGYTFDGWATKQGGGVTYSNGQSVTNLSTGDSVLLYAVWNINKWDISFDLNAGFGTTPTSQNQLDYGSTVTLPAYSSFVNSGKYCIGWNTTSNAATALSSYTVPDNNQKLYAVWLNNANQPAPTGLTGVAPTYYNDATGSITGTTTAMQWSTTSGGTYTTCGTSITGLTPGTYYIRYSSFTGYNASPDTAVTVGVGGNRSQPAPMGLTGVAPTYYNDATGSITGTTTAMQWSTTSGGTYTTCGTSISGLNPGTYYVRFMAYAGYDASPDTAVTVGVGGNRSQPAPTTALGVSPGYYREATGSITGTTTAMEYKLSTDDSYTAVTGTSVTNLVPGTYYIRFAAYAGYNASSDQTVTITDGPNRSQSSPTTASGVSPTYYRDATGSITGTTIDMEYKLSTAGSYTAVTGTSVADLVPGTYYVRFAAYAGYNASSDQTVTITDGPNRSQPAPTGLTGVATTYYGESTGSITGTTTDMEYKLSTTGSYTAVTGTSITGLAAGTYYVRFITTTGYDAGTDASITVNNGPVTITFDANGGTGGTSAFMYVGDNIIIPTVTLAGHVFWHWNDSVSEKVPAGNATYVAQWVLLGDISDDEDIDSVDALMTLRSVSGKYTLNEKQLLAADVSKDGEIDTLDALMILRHVSGKIEQF